jgi:hypothetical protein
MVIEILTGREMAVCQATGHEMAVCQAKGRSPTVFGQVPSGTWPKTVGPRPIAVAMILIIISMAYAREHLGNRSFLLDMSGPRGWDASPTVFE